MKLIISGTRSKVERVLKISKGFGLDVTVADADAAPVPVEESVVEVLLAPVPVEEPATELVEEVTTPAKKKAKNK